MAIAIRLVGQFKVKDKFVGLDVARLAQRILAWAKERYPSGLLHGDDSAGDGVHFLWLLFHEAGEPIAIELSPQGRIVVEIDTTPVGPGYHDHVCTLLDEIAAEFRISWPKSPTPDHHSPDASYDDTGHFFRRDNVTLDNAFAGWIGGVAKTILGLRERVTSVAIKLPSDCTYDAPGDALTVLGPRSREWLARVAGTPQVGADIFPWWDRGWSPEHDLKLAFSMMWLHLPWALPRTQTQREDLERVLNLLASAHAADPTLPMPWAEWAELIDMTHRLREEHADEVPRVDAALESRVRSLAQHAEPTIGYRRHPMTCRDLPGGWSITIPGQMTRDFEDDGGTWIAYDDSRTIRFNSMTISPSPGVSPPTIEELCEGDVPPIAPPLEASRPIDWSEPSTQGRAYVGVEFDDDGSRRRIAAATILNGWNIGLCTVAFESIEDRDWAVEICRSCRQAGT